MMMMIIIIIIMIINDKSNKIKKADLKYWIS